MVSTSAARVTTGESSDATIRVIAKHHSTNAVSLAEGTAFAPKNVEIVPEQMVVSSSAAPNPPRRAERFEVVQNWEGVVTTVEETTFHAEVRPTNNPSARPTDELEIDLVNVAPGDIEMVKEGSVFYLTVGTLTLPGEGPQQTTRLIFRRMPRWSANDIKRRDSRVDALWSKMEAAYAKQFGEPVNMSGESVSTKLRSSGE